MSLIQLIILAIIQGVTEFIPVSSSAHLALAPMFVEGWYDQGPMIDVAMHVGSLGAVLVYFHREVGQLFTGGVDVMRLRRTPERQLFVFLAMATVPFLIVGGGLYLAGLTTLFRDPLIIGLASIGFGLLLWWSDRRPPAQQTHPEKPPSSGHDFTWRQVMIIGLAQTLAVIPGTSRSGITITAARFMGISRPEAARFSMLLAIPTISILGLVAAGDLLSGEASGSFRDGAIGAVFSFFAALATIHLFLKMSERMSFTPFVIYRCVLGLVLIVIAVM